MSGWKKLAAASAGGDSLDVDDVFSTYVYDGNSGAQTFVNGLDLAGEGGLVWSKRRNSTDTGQHVLVDSERNVSTYAYILNSDNANSQGIEYGWNWSFNSNGYSLNTTSAEINDTPNREYCSWSFRKAPKFFDIVTWNGNSTARTISHNLGQKPGMILVKALNNVRDWAVWHKDLNTNEYLVLNTSNSNNNDSNVFTATEPTSTEFSIGTDLKVNYSSFSYIAYVFADNNGEGEFGPDSDQDIIKCGSYTGNSSNTGPVVDVGFEPQFLLIKGSNGNWVMVDSMRGFSTNPANSAMIYANRSNAEFSTNWFNVTPTGFQPTDNSNDINSSGQTYIYMAIRRGPLAAPKSATDVFGIDINTGQTGMQTGILNDMGIAGGISNTDKWYIGSRLTQGKYLQTNTPSPEPSGTSAVWNFDSMDSFFNGSTWNGYIGYGWKRAPNFFDVVSYTGNGSGGLNVAHNLSVVPEMMWIKSRSLASENWGVYHKDVGNLKQLVLNATGQESGNSNDYWNSTTPTSTQFTVGGDNSVNSNNQTYIAYLFASLPGISKVGSYTGNGSSQTIDCGFSAGARFILVRRTDNSGDWYVWDTERGIVAGNDPYLELNTTDAEVTSTDWVDPDNSGFIVNGTTINASSAEYIFYAIA